MGGAPRRRQFTAPPLRLTTTPDRLVVRDVPAAHWALGALFAVVGTVVGLGPLGLFSDAAAYAPWVRALTALGGLVAVAAGGWVAARAPLSTLVLEPRAAGARRLRLTRVGLAGRHAAEWPADAVAAVTVVEGEDDEGGAVFRLHLALRDGTAAPVSPVWAHGRDAATATAAALAAALGVPVRAEREATGARR